MKHSIVPVLFLCLISGNNSWAQQIGTGSAPPYRTSASPTERDLRKNLSDYLQAGTDKNLAYFKRTLTDDFTYVPKNGGASDRAEFLEDISSPDKEKPPRIYNVKVIPLNESAALLTYDEVDTGDQPRYRRVTQVWIKPADQWKLKFMQTTPNIWSLADTD